MSDAGRKETARRNGLVWHRSAPGKTPMENLRRWIDHNSQVRPTFDDDLRAVLSDLRRTCFSRMGADDQGQSWGELKRASEPGSEPWAIANAALFVEHALSEGDTDDKLRRSWNAALELGKTLGGLSLGDAYALGARLAPGNDAQRRSGTARQKPDTFQVIKQMKALLEKNPGRGESWAAAQIARKMYPRASEVERKRHAGKLRKRYGYHKKKAGEE